MTKGQPILCCTLSINNKLARAILKVKILYFMICLISSYNYVYTYDIKLENHRH